MRGLLSFFLLPTTISDMGRRWGKRSGKQGVFDPNNADRIKHTRMGVWDVYEEKNPDLPDIPIGAQYWERFLEIKRDLPYVWTMIKDISSLRDCWSLLVMYTFWEVVGALLPAVSLW